jgi:hypothetical protein
MLQYQINMIERESKYKDSKLVFKNNFIKNNQKIRTFRIKLIKKFRYLSIFSTNTLIQSLFFGNYKIFEVS